MSAADYLRDYLVLAPVGIVADALLWLVLGTGAIAWWRRRRRP